MKIDQVLELVFNEFKNGEIILQEHNGENYSKIAVLNSEYGLFFQKKSYGQTELYILNHIPKYASVCETHGAAVTIIAGPDLSHLGYSVMHTKIFARFKYDLLILDSRFSGLILEILSRTRQLALQCE